VRAHGQFGTVPVQAAASGAARGVRGAAASLGGVMKANFDPLRLMLFLLIIMNVSRVHQHFPFLRPLRPAMLLVLLTALYAYLNPKFVVLENLFRTWPAKVIAALGIMACLSVPLSISMGASAKFILEEYSKVLVFAFLLIISVRNTRDLYTLVWGFTLAIGFLSLLSLFVFRMSSAGGVMRIAGGYSYDANDIGTVCVVGIGIALLMFQSSTGLKKAVTGLVLLGAGMAIAKTGSRGAFVGLVALGAALLVMLKTVRLDKRIGFVLVVGLGIGLAAPQGYWEQMGTLLSPKEDYNWSSPTGRKAVAKRGITYMMRNPVTGIGIDNFGRAEGLISERARNFRVGMAGIKWSAAHNSFLQAAAEMGLPGVTLFSTLIFGSIVGMNRLRRRLPRHWSKGDAEERFLYLASLYLPVAMIGFAVAGFFVSFAYLDLVYILAAFVAATYICVDQRLGKAGTAPAVPAAPPVPVVGRTVAAARPRGPEWRSARR